MRFQMTLWLLKAKPSPQGKDLLERNGGQFSKSALSRYRPGGHRIRVGNDNILDLFWSHQLSHLYLSLYHLSPSFLPPSLISSLPSSLPPLLLPSFLPVTQDFCLDSFILHDARPLTACPTLFIQQVVMRMRQITWTETSSLIPHPRKQSACVPPSNTTSFVPWSPTLLSITTQMPRTSSSLPRKQAWPREFCR